MAQGAPPRGLALTLCAPWDSEPRGPSFFHRHAGLGFKGTWRVGISPPHIGAQLHYRRGCRQRTGRNGKRHIMGAALLNPEGARTE